MNKNFVSMCSYYRSETHGLIRTVCRAFVYDTGDPMIAFVAVDGAGNASDVLLMPEDEFIKIFLPS